MRFDLGNGHEIEVTKDYAAGYAVRFYEDGRFLMTEHYGSLEDIAYEYDIEF